MSFFERFLAIMSGEVIIGLDVCPVNFGSNLALKDDGLQAFDLLPMNTLKSILDSYLFP